MYLYTEQKIAELCYRIAELRKNPTSEAAIMFLEHYRNELKTLRRELKNRRAA